MRVRKGLILAAGHGTRMLPVTKAGPKEMLPLVDKPVIHYVVEEAVASGIEQIVMVTSAGKRAVEDYFDRAPVLERTLEREGRARAAGGGARRRGDGGHGLRAPEGAAGHRARRADRAARHRRRAVRPLLSRRRHRRRPAGDAAAHRRLRAPRGLRAGRASRCPHEEISHYGSMAVEPLEDDVFRVLSLVEKPKPEEAPSDLAIVGRYVLTPDIFDALKRDEAGRRRRDPDHGRPGAAAEGEADLRLSLPGQALRHGAAARPAPGVDRAGAAASGHRAPTEGVPAVAGPGRDYGERSPSARRGRKSATRRHCFDQRKP